MELLEESVSGIANNTISNVGSVANNGISTGGSTIQGLGNNVKDLGSNLGNNLEKGATSLFQSPVLLIGGIAALILILNKQ